MTSLVIKRGLERAAALFENELPAETIADWRNKAKRIGENLDKIKRHEFIDATGKPGGPADLLASLSMPLIGLRAILTGRPLLDFM